MQREVSQRIRKITSSSRFFSHNLQQITLRIAGNLASSCSCDFLSISNQRSRRHFCLFFHRLRRANRNPATAYITIPVLRTNDTSSGIYWSHVEIRKPEMTAAAGSAEVRKKRGWKRRRKGGKGPRGIAIRETR